MAKNGAYILDTELLNQLNDEIKQTGEKMANIDSHVGDYLRRVLDALERQLDFLREKLDEAEARLSEAESALSSCQASQVFIPEMGGYVPTCISEEVEVSSAREEVMEWQQKYSEGQQIVGECQREISDYESGGHALIENMANNQTPKAIEQLRIGISKLENILETNMGIALHDTASVAKEASVDPDKSLVKDSRFDLFRKNIRNAH